MSFPASNQRMQIDQTTTGVSSQLQTFVMNAKNLNRWLATFTDEVLKAAPYNYTDDELYALRRATQLMAQLSDIASAGGTMDPADATTMTELSTKFGGITFVVPRQAPVF